MSNSISRRGVLKQAAAVSGAAVAAVSGAVALGASGHPSAEPQNEGGGAERTKVAGRKFQAYVSRGGRASLEQVTLLPLGPRQVLVRTQASHCNYSLGVELLDVNRDAKVGRILGNGGVGIVEAIGSQVKRVQVGDQVVVAATSQCGQCYNCLRGRADSCLTSISELTGQTAVIIGNLSDGAPVVQHNNAGGLSQFMVPFEERCVPVFAKVPAAELSLLANASLCGLSATRLPETEGPPLEPASNVVVLGAGPVGLSAIQGARIQGAAQIIAVEPIRMRRELALKLGATIALDPNVEGSGLVAKIRALCKSKLAGRVFSGGGDSGPDFVIEAVGGDVSPPKAEAGPDPNGVLSLQQAWDLVSAVGYLVTVSTGQKGTFSVPGTAWANGSKNHYAGGMARANAMRDVPIYTRLIETGKFDAKSLVTATYPLDQARDALQAVMDRTTIGAVIAFP
jgi:S-(hydroxymethyl)glutathione dehydrogenase/alcohol dehydrogenase